MNEISVKNVGEALFKRLFWIGITAILLVTIFLAFKLNNLGFDYDFEKFFPVNDDETAYFFEHREKYESDNDFLLIAIEREKGIFNKDFLTDVDQYSSEIQGKAPYIQQVISITNEKERFILPGGGGSFRKWIDLKKNDLKSDSIRIYRSKELVNSLVASDGKSLCIFIRHNDYLSKKKSDELIGAVLKMAEKYGFEKVRVAGRTIGQKFYIEKMTSEMFFFISLSAALIVLFLFVAFRSLWGILLPQVVIVLSTVWVLGLMGWFNEPINILLITLPSIMFVVSMSDVIHLVSRYLDALRSGLSKFDAIMVTVKEIGFATFLTSLTTAIGFYSLYLVNVQPIQVFGLVTGTGVMIAYLLTIVLLPILFYIFPSPQKISVDHDNNFWKDKLHRWFSWLLKNPKKVIWLNILLLIISGIGVMMIKVDNYLMDDVSAREPLKQDFNYLDEHYGGIRPFELVISLKDPGLNIWDAACLKEIDKVEKYLTERYGVQIKNSLVNTLKILNRSAHAGNPDYYKLPESKRELRNLRRIVRIAGQGRYVRSVMDSLHRETRISGMIPDWGNQKVTGKNTRLKHFLDKELDTKGFEYHITGTAHLFDKNLRYLSTSLVQGLSLSIVIVALIMGFIYRSFRMMVISIIPNIIPLAAIAGIMGFFGVELKISTAIVFTIAFGIAVDDTIHLLGKFKHELMQGKSKLYALKRAYLTTGKAMVLTTLILCAGFMLLVFSSFMGTFFMGVMMSVTLFVALVADLTLLPVLLILFYKVKEKK